MSEPAIVATARVQPEKPFGFVINYRDITLRNILLNKIYHVVRALLVAPPPLKGFVDTPGSNPIGNSPTNWVKQRHRQRRDLLSIANGLDLRNGPGDLQVEASDGCGCRQPMRINKNYIPIGELR